MLARGKTEQLSEMANRLLPQAIEMGHASMMTGRALSAMLDNEIINLVLATHCTVPASVERHVCAINQHSHTQKMLRSVQPGAIEQPGVKRVLRLEVDFENLRCDFQHNGASTVVFDRVFGRAATQEDAAVG